MRNLRLALAFLASLSAIARPSTTHACAPAMPKDQPPLRIRGEEALIVWDEAHKEEHFVRKAIFDTSVKSFGFLVPTPTRPKLAEASPAVFDALANLTKPEVVEETRWTVLPSLLFLSMRSKSESIAAGVPAGAVRVLEETRVAGMDATVLAATDADALGRWLGERGFEFRPALRDWLKPYVDAGYTLTAFRYERPDVAGPGAIAVPIAPTAVRLSFKSERPLYPYREPSDAAAVPGRTLSLFLVGPRRLDGALGAGAAPWISASTRFADAVAAAPLAATLAGVTLPDKPWVTQIVDETSLRAREDVFFRPGDARVRPPPFAIYKDRELFLPLELILPAILLFVWRLRKRRRPMV